MFNEKKNKNIHALDISTKAIKMVQRCIWGHVERFTTLVVRRLILSDVTKLTLYILN